MKKTVLIADDEKHIVKFMTNVLEGAGFNVISAYNGAEAYEKAIEEKPDFIVTDDKMPVMDGIDLMERLQGSPLGKIPVVMLITSQKTYKYINGTPSIRKPFNSKQLLEMMKA